MPAISKASAAQQAAEYAQQEKELRQRAARQAASRALVVEKHPIAECRVLPKGDGKVSTGFHAAGIGEAYYERGETFKAPQPMAQGLEDLGYVEIMSITPVEDDEAA